MHVNLLPRGTRQRLILRRRLGLWMLVWAACAAFCAAFVGIHYRALVLERRTFREFEVRCSPVRQVAAESLDLRQRLREEEKRIAQLRQLTPQDRSLPLLAVISQAAHALEGRLQVRRLEVQLANIARASSASKPAVPEAGLKTGAGQVTLEAVGQSDDVAASFLDLLRATQVFRHVELKASAEWGPPGADHRKFDVLCSF
jgi:hypothetical protein